MISLAQSEPGIPVPVDDLDADPELVNCVNGTLNLSTGELQPHRQSDMITKILSCGYKPGARSDVWDRFLVDVTQGDAELAGYLQRVFGYALLGAVKEKHLWFIYGPSNSGKSTFINAVFEVFGDYGRAASFETWLTHSVIGGNRGDIVDLIGARLVTSVEVRRGAKFDEALLKSVTGGDRVKAAAKYEREVEFTPAFTLVLAGNDAPIVRDDDDGMWTRMRRVPFSHSIDESKQDKRLGEKLKTAEVQEAILAWLVAGYHTWKKEGIGTCKSVEKSNDEYRTEMDRVKGFFEDELEFSIEGVIPTAQLRAAYEMWASDNGVKTLHVKEFNKRLRERGCVAGKSGAVRRWNGVTLIKENNSIVK
ncbi:MAG: hypothetical protein GY849_11215 [Deltaproteobacteria bacterium]|nr:hypothetical protein [Deltaproteobacteria bacterium]